MRNDDDDEIRADPDPAFYDEGADEWTEDDGGEWCQDVFVSNKR